MKNIVLIGASGFVGSALLKEALDRGYAVKAIVRHPEKVKVENKHLQLIKADVTDVKKLAEVVKGADAVISAYNPGWSNPNIYDDTLKGYRSIIDAVKSAGVSRLQIVGGAGSLFVAPGKTVLQSGIIPDAIKPGVESLAKVLTDYLLPEKQLDWVFFSPAGTIEPGERTTKYRLGKNDLIVDEKGNSKISVEDYAKAMLDELDAPKHHRERFTIGY
ncbi:NAD(P)-dependent oxidoreductase [Dysgonomonas sp. GY617]|uniref:NAD(P)-dependent oxidoreductase n=1 Tax=Dysgonomonas sp. GY617 TaxID=2780420 RepID=UPI001884670F|nr:NAD(P)-dependent oxidoreductase [Dysgonomonas sp. GY617]MBF0574607.1 NAD(P)-dependent oxidoreductase [Dysgonomonas sp. GY617]